MRIYSTTEYSLYEATVDKWKTGLLHPTEALQFANMLLDEVGFIIDHSKKWGTSEILSSTYLKIDNLKEKLQ